MADEKRLTLFEVSDGGDTHWIASASRDGAIEAARNSYGLGVDFDSNEVEIVAEPLPREQTFGMGPGDDNTEEALKMLPPGGVVVRSNDEGRPLWMEAAAGEWADHAGEGTLVAIRED